MSGGYMGALPWVDLNSGAIREIDFDERIARDFIGGYGVGARLIFEHQQAGVDPLGPQNILGFYAGPLTGTSSIIGSRFTVMGKSPLTGTWGDANCGGFFGPKMKFAGVDGIFFTGAAGQPVYALIENGRCSIHSAVQLWGKDTTQTEEILKAAHGDDIAVACIGPAGEKRSLIAAIIHDKGRAAARSGLGAVMGSKRLKAVVVKGNRKVPVADEKQLEEVHRRHIKGLKDFPVFEALSHWGTCNEMEGAIISGDAPLKNWAGAYPEDFANAKALSGDAVIAYQVKKYACWRCPVACGGYCTVSKGPYAVQGHKPEYETIGAFGGLCLNDNLESVIKANHLCNLMGLDTISAGATIAFAIECYDRGLISKSDTGGLELRWGDHAAIIAVLELMGRRQGVGDLLADGSRAAAQKIGRGAEELAMHIRGQEVPMHDAKLYPGLAISYQYNATPARHTLSCEDWKRPGMPTENRERYQFAGRGADHLRYVAYRHVTDCAGLCYFSMYLYNAPEVVEYMQAVTGWDYDMENVTLDGERILTLRHLFNLREGENPRSWGSPGRTVGKPPMQTGPLKGVELDMEQMVKDYYRELDWDLVTSMPSPRSLERLGLGNLWDAWGRKR